MSILSKKFRVHLDFWLDGRDLRDGVAGAFVVVVLCLLPASRLLSLLDLGQRSSLVNLERSAVEAIAANSLVSARLQIIRMAADPAGRSRARLMMAKLHLAAGRPPEARAELLRLVQMIPEDRDPTRLEALFILAESLLTGPGGSSDQALQHLNEILEVNPGHPAANELAARVATERRQWITVLEHLDLTPLVSRPDLRLMRAAALWNLDRKKEARLIAAEIEETLQAFQATAVQPEFMARCLALQGEFSRALECLPAAGDGTEAGAASERLRVEILWEWSKQLDQSQLAPPAEILPLLEDYLIRRGRDPAALRVFVRQTELALAQPRYRMLLLQSPEPGGAEKKAFHFWYQTLAALQAGDTEKAQEHFATALSSHEAFPSIMRHLLALDEALSADGKVAVWFGHSLALLEALERFDPNLEGLDETAAKVLYRRGEKQRAAGRLRLALITGRAVDPESVMRLSELCEELGFEAMQRGNEWEASELFREAHQWQPQFGRLEINQGLAWAAFGQSMELGTQSAVRLRTLFNADPENRELRQALGMVRARLGEKPEATDLLDGDELCWTRPYALPEPLVQLRMEVLRQAAR